MVDNSAWGTGIDAEDSEVDTEEMVVTKVKKSSNKALLCKAIKISRKENMNEELVGSFGDEEEENNADLERAVALLLSMKTGKPLTQNMIKISSNTPSNGRRVGNNLKIETPTLKQKEPELDYVSSSKTSVTIIGKKPAKKSQSQTHGNLWVFTGVNLIKKPAKQQKLLKLFLKLFLDGCHQTWRQCHQHKKYSRVFTPASFFKYELWRRQVISTLCLWAGAQLNMWNISKLHIAEVLEHILPIVFPDQPSLTWDLNSQSKLIAIISFNVYQCLCEWHHRVGSAAIALFITFFVESSPDEAKLSSCSLLDHLMFLYEDLDNTDPDKAFRSQLMVQLLAATHLPAIKGFVHIPELNTARFSQSSVKGIIGLCSAVITGIKGKAVVQTPLKLNVSSGKESTTTCAFSKQNWGSVTRKLTVAAGSHTINQLMGILELARVSQLRKERTAGEFIVEDSDDEYSRILCATFAFP
ncbi:hypothetical protein PAXRUDRAFT_28186 [Paxillus rubicundulus Ve08.2h10]|uniref:Uncharacterized protein n=1 Tax=Paxillus rubicundulus Ve08.2h10 TaxID=930991 RepID=A0A0D0DGH3_9AGAM|nr:hypothetical protein PAXRUDRAFT_28186 [Paxillus rubicundulus Ve08.2h10]